MSLSSLSSILAILAQCLLVGVGVKLPPSSPIRLIIPLLTLPLVYAQFTYCQLLPTTSEFYPAVIGSQSIALWLSTARVLWEAKFEGSFWTGFGIPLNPRLIGTSMVVKNVPPTPKYYGEKNVSRLAFIVRETCFLAWSYLVIDLVITQERNMSLKEKEKMFGGGQEYEFWGLTAEQIAIRFVSSTVSWFVMARIVMSGIMRVYRIGGVMIGGDPKNYPPLLGSMWDAYSVRQFWGKFWHQTFRSPFTTFSNFVARKVLQLPRPSILERYTNIFMAFTASAILHVGWDHLVGKNSPFGTMLFFQSQAAVIMLEDGVQELWRQYAGSSGGSVRLWQRLVGYCWVLISFAVTSPPFLYPDAVSQRPNLWILPYNVVDQIGLPVVRAAVAVGAIFNWFVFKPEI